MLNILWEPDDKKPQDASALEIEIQGVAPGAQVKLTLKDGEWFVRALTPAAMCNRGTEFSSRDASALIAEILNDHGHPARVFPGRRRAR